MEKKDDFIFETEHWFAVLARDQTYLGRTVILAKSRAASLSDLSKDEWLDFMSVLQKLEIAMKKSFTATMFNWTCLMNDGYQTNPPKPYVHFHLRPRYDHEVVFEGEKFEDIEFGHHYLRGVDRFVSAEMKKKIIEKIRENL